jgi:hypothetical protein
MEVLMKWLAIVLVLASSPAFADQTIWNDVTRQHRDDSVLNQDGEACDAQLGPIAQGTSPSRAYQRCMRAHGWLFQRRIKQAPEKTWIDPDTGDTCRDLKVNGTVIGSECGNMW